MLTGWKLTETCPICSREPVRFFPSAAKSAGRVTYAGPDNDNADAVTFGAGAETRTAVQVSTLAVMHSNEEFGTTSAIGLSGRVCQLNRDTASGKRELLACLNSLRKREGAKKSGSGIVIHGNPGNGSP